MGIFSSFLFSLFIGVVISEEFSIDDSTEDSLVPVTIFITTEQYHACKEDGDCTFTPHSVSLNEPGHLHDNLEYNSYFELCRKFHFKMEKLEPEHPEVKLLKLKLIQMFDTFSSELDFESQKGELVAIKLLDLVQNLIEKLRVEFNEKSQKVPKPEIIPTIEPIIEEVTAEPEHEPDQPMFVGSIRGIPGIHFPNYTEIPITSFTCSDKHLIPGFYADLETGCQVFHLCYEHRRESFLCPIGTIFNQPILACDYWYSANCSEAPIYYEEPNIPEPETVITTVTEEKVVAKHPKKDVESKDFLKFLPVTAKVTDIPEFGKPIETPKLKPSVTLKDTEAIADKIFDGILSLGSHVVSKSSDALRKIPDPQDEIPMKFKPKYFPFQDKLAVKAFSTLPLSKAKKVTAAVKLSAATKIASAAAIASGKAKIASFAAIPVMKSKVASAAVLPMIKTKVASAKAASLKVPIVAAKAASLKVPIVAAKAASLKVPVVKAKVASLKVPIVAAKAASLKVPIVAAKVASLKVPIVAAKAASLKVPIVAAKAASLKIPVVKAKAASLKIPIVKGKLYTLPLAKTKLGAAAIPALKVKKMAKAVPYLKMAALKPKFAVAPLKVKSAIALPIMKAKLARAAVSPLTKKALALGYLKLLKAKKLAIMG